MKKYLRMQVFGIAVVSVALMTACSKTPEAGGAALPGTSNAANVADNVADNDVTINVKTALQQDATLGKFDLGVITLKGDVRLTGVVDTQDQIDAAVKLARGSEGVHSLHNELAIKK